MTLVIYLSSHELVPGPFAKNKKLFFVTNTLFPLLCMIFFCLYPDFGKGDDVVLKFFKSLFDLGTNTQKVLSVIGLPRLTVQ